jgi:2-methylisocitrate lyase-like PEP mutase family enzyme
LIARTDARASEGLDAALERAELYVAAGADAIFVEAVRTHEELALVPKALDGVPTVANMVEGGRTPLLSASELEDMGYRIAIFANALLRLEVSASRRGLKELKERGTTAGILDDMLGWEERQQLVRLSEHQDAEAWIIDRARAIVANAVDRGAVDRAD